MTTRETKTTPKMTTARADRLAEVRGMFARASLRRDPTGKERDARMAAAEREHAANVAKAQRP